MAKQNLRSRTNAKILYAKLHLAELRECEIPGRGHDFERSHLEAFLAQLFGAYAALFQELNENLGCGLMPDNVTLGKMRNAMKVNGSVSKKLTELFTLEQDDTTWLSIAKKFRDYVSHIGGIPIGYYHGGPSHGITTFSHPDTLIEIPGEYFDNLEKWVVNMEALIDRMRV